jgi:hypothetical protein
MRSALVLIVVMSLVPSNVRAEDTAPQTPTTKNCECAKPAVVVDKGATARRNAKLLAVGGATLWVASVVWANKIQDDFNAEKQTFTGGDIDSARRSMMYASGLFVGSVATLGVSAYLYFRKGREREVRTTVAPVVTQDRVGVALGRRF